MKRIIVLVLIATVALSLASCSVFGGDDASTTTPFTLKSNEELQGLDPTSGSAVADATESRTRVYRSDSYKAAQVRNFFLDVVYGSSKIDDIKSEQLEKWNTTVKYDLSGRYTNADVQTVASVARTLNSIDGFPGMKKAQSKEEANLFIKFVAYVPKDDDSNGINHPVPTTEFIQESGGEINSSSVTKCSENSGYIYEATIEIGVGQATDKARSQALSKEILRSCGMPFGSEVYADSVFAENPYITGGLAEIDLMAIELLYNSEIPGSCDFSECYYILDNLLS